MANTSELAELAEGRRLAEDAAREANWKRWGPYLSERQWGTVREDYSVDGNCWASFSHDHARSRAYRWGEDGLLGVCDRECRLCFSVALWNGRDPILKERLYGLINSEGNHGEDVKEQYFYLESSPTHSWMRALYKYPQAPFPYGRLIEENRRRDRSVDEFEIVDSGVFDEGRYFDVQADYAKASPNDLLIRLTITNRGPDAAKLHVLPTLWFKNSWSWGCEGEGCEVKPSMSLRADGVVEATQATLGMYRWQAKPLNGLAPKFLFTENESNAPKLYGMPHKPGAYYKDAFHDYLIANKADAINPKNHGTKAAAHYHLSLGAGESVEIELRLSSAAELPARAFGADFDKSMTKRRQECKQYYGSIFAGHPQQQQRVATQALAGLLWSKQYYHYVVREWLNGDPAMPPPPPERDAAARNREWKWHLFNRDVISMPDKWEYPWYAAWDLAFHMLPMA
ncbi:MAG TPA: hypothetical protein VF624_00850, partial [Tepidisphaeraceae bacterium]